MAERGVAEGLTVEATRRTVADLKECPTSPEWSDATAMATAVVNGEMKLAEIERLTAAADRAAALSRKPSQRSEH